MNLLHVASLANSSFLQRYISGESRPLFICPPFRLLYNNYNSTTTTPLCALEKWLHPEERLLCFWEQARTNCFGQRRQIAPSATLTNARSTLLYCNLSLSLSLSLFVTASLSLSRYRTRFGPSLHIPISICAPSPPLQASGACQLGSMQLARPARLTSWLAGEQASERAEGAK